MASLVLSRFGAPHKSMTCLSNGTGEISVISCKERLRVYRNQCQKTGRGPDLP